MHGLYFPLFALSRLRMGSDGQGVTTLVAAKGCPLRCKMCLNPQSLSCDTQVKYITPHELYEIVRKDDLYFQATGGGVTFGGGEPLLHAAFIREFRKISGDRWRLVAETSLNIPEKNLIIATECIDGFIVDIKDMNPDIYRNYTGKDNAPVIRNLRKLLSITDPRNVTIRVPHIPGYNTDTDIRCSIEILKDFGAVIVDVFDYIHPNQV